MFKHRKTAKDVILKVYSANAFKTFSFHLLHKNAVIETETQPILVKNSEL